MLKRLRFRETLVRVTLVLGGLLVPLAALACGDAVGPQEQASPTETEEASAGRLIHFEGRPGETPLGDQFDGVLFWSEDTADESCASNGVQPGWEIIPLTAGALNNNAAWNVCSSGNHWVGLTEPSGVVSFEIRYHHGHHPQDVIAWDGLGQQLPASAIERSTSSYVSMYEFPFALDSLRISSSSGVSRFGWSTYFYGVLLDNIRY